MPFLFFPPTFLPFSFWPNDCLRILVRFASLKATDVAFFVVTEWSFGSSETGSCSRLVRVDFVGWKSRR